MHRTEIRRLSCAFLSLLTLWACAPLRAAEPAIDANQAQVAAGRRLAEVNCSSCHAIGERGESRLAEAPPFRTLSERYPLNMLEEAFAEGVLVGHSAMPEFRLEPAQIDALVAYLQSVQPRRSG